MSVEGYERVPDHPETHEERRARHMRNSARFRAEREALAADPSHAHEHHPVIACGPGWSRTYLECACGHREEGARP